MPLAAVGAKIDELAGLASAAADGDPDASATLIAHLGASILRVVRKALGRDHPDVEDVAQDATIGFLDALATFRGESSVTHFAQRIALLTALAARRRTRARSRWSEGESELGPDGGKSTLRSPLDLTLVSRRRALVLRLLDELPDTTAEALALHFMLGYTVEEIAASQGVSSNTVWSRLRLGKQALRRRLQKDVHLLDALSVSEAPEEKTGMRSSLTGKVKG